MSFNPNTVLAFNSGVTNVLESSGSDVTTGSDVTISFDVRNIKRTNIMLKNLGPNSMTLTVRTRNVTGGSLANVDVNALTIVSGSTFRYLSDQLLAKIEFLVKSTALNFPTTYYMEYIRELK
jgi:hypothetical protein